ncbi:sensor histidine kinase [Paracoccus aminophilus]|uniref:histidine kinase n=1 Tax=Paracoccus aminophilus JCM 7686 TaxID=1367847 RepID=S5YI49_PARAH|nr:HAMP domain-containing sensor histidine kinase [Paracoccus aminophilus]AGT11148.1 integral membrane sensor signal transduction histidine kinase [Paracoccus aminophilus JCM 7686]
MRGKSYFLPTGAAICGFVLLFLYAFVQLVEIQHRITTKVGENMLWAIYQAEREALRLQEALVGAKLHLATDDEIRLRLDILYSRITLLKEPPQAAWVTHLGATSRIEENARRVDALAALIDAAPSPSAVDLNQARAILRPILSDMGELANQTMIGEQNERVAQWQEERQSMYLIMAALVGTLLAGAFLSWRLVLTMRATERAGEELRQHKIHLEDLVSKRTDKLNAALATERHAKEVYRSFITTVSHQFRTPLAIIDMVAQRLIRRPEKFTTAEIAEKARRIRSATQRLNQLVTSVTRVAKLDGGDVAISRKPHDLNEILRSAAAFNAEFEPHRRIELDLASDPLVCDCDPALIEQVALNLISNAIKYSDDLTVIRIRSWCAERRCCCAISDHGIGIPAADQNRIFERFFRAGNASLLVGSGLGLNLSHTIIELHGGRLNFHSVESEGTTFTFDLPASSDLKEV